VNRKDPGKNNGVVSISDSVCLGNSKTAVVPPPPWPPRP
jgi:hypothetical protein